LAAAMNIASMPLPQDGYFFARAESIGTTDVELTAASRGEITKERKSVLITNMQEAMIALSRCPPEGKC
jgi:hypothetical protein